MALQQLNISRNTENMDHESVLFLEPKRRKYMFNSIKAILSTVWEILCATGEAKYAAELARNQKWAQAQDLYKK
jgi:hypothetical protein